MVVLLVLSLMLLGEQELRFKPRTAQNGILSAWLVILVPSVNHAQLVLTSMATPMAGACLAKTSLRTPTTLRVLSHFLIALTNAIVP